MSESSSRAATERGSFPFTRKYLGSKRLLRERIAGSMLGIAGPPGTFLDGFCGTGSVGIAMAALCPARVTAVDTLRSNCVILRGFAHPVPHMEETMARLNALAPQPGYISASYAGTYFTAENCGRMDAVREDIELLLRTGRIDGAGHDLLLASYLIGADRVANTIGQYDAFLKNISSGSMVNGRHLVDDRVHTPFMLQPLERRPGNPPAVVEGDVLDLLPGMDFDVAYFDPPYNHRQYCDNYHVLENLARWEKPALKGKTRKFDQAGLRSPFSRKTGAGAAMRRLVAGARARHVFLSYSSEGILSMDEILSILSLRGAPEVIEMPYPVFGNGAGVAARRTVTEYLFHVAPGG